MPRARSIAPAKAPKVAEASRLSSAQNQKQDASATLSLAPKGRKTIAQGIALGNRPTTNPSPEGAAQGWRIVKLEDVADIRSGNGFPIKYQGRTEGEFPFFKVGDISRNWQKGMITLTNGEHCLTQAEVKAIRAKTLPAGSVVFAKIGAAVALNRRAILGVESLVDNNVMALVPSAKTTSRFLFYFMCQVDLGASTRGGAVPSLRRGDVADLEIPLPPLPEQRRIVARIEELFSRLDAGVAALRHAKAQLQRYRQSVLAAAVTGQLTQAWREQHPDTESAEELLERILEQRREWESRGKYKDPTAPEDSELPALPEGWTWTAMEQLGLVIGGLTKNSKRNALSVKVPYLRVANVYADELRLDEIKEIGVAKSELGKLLVRKGDLLIVEGNGSKDQIGRLAIWDGSIDPCVHQNHLIKVRLIEPALGKYVMAWMLSPIGRPHIERVASSTSGLYTLSVGKVAKLPVPLLPLAEQHQIVVEVEARTTAIDYLAAELDRQITRSNRLRQSTLAAAFSAEL